MENKGSSDRKRTGFQLIQSNEELTKSCVNSDCPNDNPQSVTNFYKRAGSVDGYRHECKDCLTIKKKRARDKLRTKDGIDEIVYQVVKDMIRERYDL